MKLTKRKKAPVKTEPVEDVPVIDETSEENLKERRYLWTARAAAVVAVGSFCTNIVMLIALSHLSPLVRTNPFFLTFQNRDAQVVTIVRPDISESVLQVITENLIRQYIIARHAIPADYEELADRWSPEGPMRWMSTESVFGEFTSEVEAVRRQVEENHLTRQVKIASVIRQQADPKTGIQLWTAALTITEMSDDSPQPKETYWTSTLQIVYEKQTVMWEWRLKNPLGFKVRDYRIQKQDAIY